MSRRIPRLAATLVAVIALVAMLYAMLGFIVAPSIVASRLPHWAQSTLGRDVSVQSVRFNPFLLRAQLTDLRLYGEDRKEVVLAARRLAGDLDWSSLWRRGWHFDAVDAGGITLNLVVEVDGALNVAGLLPAQREDRSPRRTGLPALSVRHAQVDHGLVTFTDRRRSAPETMALRWIGVEVEHLTTQTDGDGSIVVTAVLPRGGAFASRAHLTLEPLAIDGALRIAGLNAAIPWTLLRNAEADLAEPTGRVDAFLRYAISYPPEGDLALALSDIDLDVHGLALRDADADAPPALALQNVQVRNGRFDLGRRELVLPQVRLAEGDARVRVSRSGTMNWQTLFGSDTPKREGDAQGTFTTRVEQLLLDEVNLHYVDLSRARPLHVNADGLDGGGEVLLALGGPDMQFGGSALRLAAKRLVIHDENDDLPPALAAREVAFEGGTFDFARRRIVIPELSLGKGELHFAVDRAGTMNWQALFAEAPGAGAPPPGSRTQADGDQGNAGDPRSWEILFPRLRAAGLALAYVDRSRRAPLEVRTASVSGRLDLAVLPGQANGPILLDNLQLRGERTRIGQLGAREAALEVALLQTTAGSFASDALVLSGLRVRNGDLRVRVAENGRSNWDDLLADGRDQASGERDSKDPLAVRLPELRIDDLALHFSDASRAEPLDVQAAAIDASGSLALTGRGFQAQQARAIVRDFTLGVRGRSPALRLARIEASGARMEASGMRLERVALIDGHAQLSLDRNGTLNLQRLLQARARAEAEPATRARKPAGAAGGVSLAIDAVALRDLSVEAVDHSRPRPLALTVNGIGGELALQVGPDGAARVGAATLQAGPMRLAVADAQLPLATLRSLTLVGGRLDTARRQVGASSLAVRGGAVRVVREEDGSIPLVQAVAAPRPPQAEKPGTNGAAPRVPTRQQPAGRAPGTKPGTTGWAYELGRARIEEVAVALADRSFGTPISVDVSVEGTLEGLDSAAPSGGLVDLRLDAKPGGKASVSGKLAGSSQPMKLRVDVDDLPLTPLQPVLAHYAALELKSGSLDAEAVLATTAEQDGGMRVTGSLGIDALRLDEAKTGDRFLAWKRLHAQAIQFDTAHNRLVVGRAVLDGAQARLEISREGELNIRQVLRASAREKAREAPVPDTPVQQTTAATARAPGQVDTASDETPFAALVDRLRIRDSTLRFADRSLVLPFVADITQLNGTVVSLSTRPSDRAQLQVDGRVQPYGAARASGSIQLAAPREFTDIRAEFNNVPLPKLSPYTITFAGRAVAEGTLWLDLEYRIVDGNLVGQNDITMQDLRLGERVQAPRALDLPLELAAALLTDEQGVLSLRVPVRGDLDDPTFDYATVIRAAIRNTLRRVVTAPFRFIGRLFGPDVEELDAIEFEPGSASLRPPEEEKLAVVAKSLAERPALALEVQGTFAPEEDARALRAAALESELAQRMKLELSEGERMGPIAFGQTATQLALEPVFVAQFGDDAVEALRARLTRERDSPVRRVERKAGDPIAAAGDPDLYRAMFDRLVETRAVDSRALQQLAADRTDAVLDYIVRQAGVTEQRLTIAAVDRVQAEEDRVPTQLRLRAAASGKRLPLDLETVDEAQPEEREGEPASAAAGPR